MKYAEKSRFCLNGALLMLSIAGLSVLMSDYAADIYSQTGIPVQMYLTGAMFWGGILLCEVLLHLASMYQKRDALHRENMFERKRPGILCFFSSREACIADVIMILSLLSVLIEVTFAVNHPLYVLTSIVMVLFSVHLHAVLNGNTYRYLRELHRRLEERASGQKTKSRKTAVRKKTTEDSRKGDRL